MVNALAALNYMQLEEAAVAAHVLARWPRLSPLEGLIFNSLADCGVLYITLPSFM